MTGQGPLDHDRFARLRELFDKAMELPLAERDAFLDRECDDDALKRDVLGLLSDGGEWTVMPSHDELDAVDAQEHAIGTAIGPYTLTSVLGEGGFGVVYLAEQSEPVRRTVALKVLKAGMDSRRVVKRFEDERRSLARMDHPNIARFYAGGLTDSGRPYFVMEHVPGEPITRYCESRSLSVDERVRLMLDVCGAIGHAHARGIIHRDLKPSNILVREGDGRATPVVIDFGIARAVERSDIAESLQTQLGQLIGTPEYISPEQVTGGEHDVDTRADVYAMGVVLYELLTGQTPLRAHTTSRLSLYELQRTIAEYEPRRPSVTLLEQDLAQTQRPGGWAPSDRKRLASRFKVDLDWIVMRCLEREPGRRYKTVQALADDLQNELDSLPVRATSPSVSYSALKFIRRNRVWVASCVLAAVGILGGAGVSVWFGMSAEAARQNEKAQRLEATRNAERVNGINIFLLDDLFSAVNAEELGSDATIADLLDRAAPTIDERFADDPSMRFRMHTLMGGMWRQLDRFDESDEHYTNAIELLDAGVDLSAGQLADPFMGRSQVFMVRGELDRAEADALRAVEIAHPEQPVEWDKIPKLAATLGGVYAAKQDFVRAEPLFEAAVLQMVDKPGSKAGQVIGMMSQRLAMLIALGRLEDTLVAANELLSYANTLEGNAAQTAEHLGRFWQTNALRRLGRKAEAASAAVGLVDAAQRIFGERTLAAASAQQTLGLLQIENGEFERGERTYREGLDIIIDLFGPYHYEVERGWNSLATVLANEGEPNRAIPYRTRGLLMRMYVAGPGEHESVSGLFGASRDVVDTDAEWLSIVADELERLEPDHPKRARFAAHAAILASESDQSTAASCFEYSLSALPHAAQRDAAARIIEAVVPRVFGDPDSQASLDAIERLNAARQ